MNLYLISQNVNNGYDTYNSAVVCAENEPDAASIHPGGTQPWGDTWADPERVKVKLIGTAIDIERGVVLASFNAG